MLSIKDAKYVKDFELELTFSNGRIGRVDLNELVHKDSRSVFAPLRDKEFFKNFTVEYTIQWVMWLSHISAMFVRKCRSAIISATFCSVACVGLAQKHPSCWR